MRLKEWALSQGIHPTTAYRWFKDGDLPVRAERVGTRTIMVYPDAHDIAPAIEVGVVLYARVSSHDQRHDLDRQTARLAQWAAARGMKVSAVVSEVGSGMNGKRAKLNRLLSDPDATVIVVEHRERFGRMNVELVESALSASGRSLVVIDDTEIDDDLVRDVTEVLTWFCARLYGQRGARNRALRALTDAAAPVDSDAAALVASGEVLVA